MVINQPWNKIHITKENQMSFYWVFKDEIIESIALQIKRINWTTYERFY